MEPKDYIGVVALLISGISLFFSIRGNKFSQRAKSAEIRVALLVKVLDLLTTHSRLERLRSELKLHAIKYDHAEIVADLDALGTEKLINDVQELYDDMETVPISAAIALYERLFHRLHRLVGRAEENEAAMIRMKAKYDEFARKKA